MSPNGKSVWRIVFYAIHGARKWKITVNSEYKRVIHFTNTANQKGTAHNFTASWKHN